MSFSPPRLVSGSGVIVYIKKKKNYVDDTIVTLATATPLVPSLSFEGRIAFWTSPANWWWAVEKPEADFSEMYREKVRGNSHKLHQRNFQPQTRHLSERVSCWNWSLGETGCLQPWRCSTLSWSNLGTAMQLWSWLWFEQEVGLRGLPSNINFSRIHWNLGSIFPLIALRSPSSF